MKQEKIQDNNFKQLLMIAYFFPPLGGSGSLRPLKLAKYLPVFGWRPMVLTVKNPDWYYAHDPQLRNELPAHMPIYRSRFIRSTWIYWLLNPFRSRKFDRRIKKWLFHPDEQIGWIPSGVLNGVRMVSRHKIKVLYSTSAPLSCHLIAYLIKKKTGLPWIADFRDEWFENPDNLYPTNWHRRFHFQLEKKIVQFADHIMTAAPGFTELLKKHESESTKFSTITMGFDPEDFKKNNESTTKELNKKFTIAFSGLFYGSFRPTLFLKALSSLIEENKIPSDKIKVVFVGANTPDQIKLKDTYRICTFTGFVSHKQSIEIIKSCDALLLLLSRERGGFVIPSKTFEYMAAGKPILALVPPDGEAASIIRKTNTGVVVDFEDVEGITSAFMKLYNDWLYGRNSFPSDPDRIKQYNQKYQTQRFAEILNRKIA